MIMTLKKWATRIIKLLENQDKLDYMRKMILSKFQPPSWEQVFEDHFYNKWRKILN